MQITDEETGEIWNITGCPYVDLDPVAMEYLRWYGYWKRGLLPEPGGVLDQSNIFMEIMEYIDTLITRKDSQDADERRTKLDSALSRSGNGGAQAVG